MAQNINLDKLFNFIELSNAEGLKNYLDKHYTDIETLLPKEYFIKAFNKFLTCDARSLTNSYRVIEILHGHFFDDNHKIKYQLSDGPDGHQKITALFNFYDKTLKHESYNTKDISRVTGIADFNTDDYRQKFKLYEERQNLRNVYKKADHIIEKDFIYSIKYPENTGFIRKLLRLPPKRKAEDILNDFTQKLPIFLDKLRNDIESDPKFKDGNGNLLLTQAELSQVIYERLSLKATRQLGISQETIDSKLNYLNTQNLSFLASKINSAISNNEISELPSFQ